MDLTRHVAALGREFATLAEAGGDESRALVERLAAALDATIRMTLLETLSAAAGEITRDLAPGSVEVRLRGRDPEFVVTTPPVDDTTPAAEQPARDLPAGEDGPAARINVRLPEQLKAAVEQAAADEGRSVNAWLVRAATAALQRPAGGVESPSGGKRSKQGFTGWVR